MTRSETATNGLAKPLRVEIAAPAMLNPYPVLFHRALQQDQRGLDPVLWRTGLSWRTLLGAQRPHIVHLHWLELLFRHHASWPERLLHWCNLLLYATAARLRMGLTRLRVPPLMRDSQR